MLGLISAIFIARTDAEAETPIPWPPDAKNWFIGKDPDAGKDWRWKEKGTEDGWMASLTRWTRVWVRSGSSWWTGRPGVLQSMGSQGIRHDWVTELNWFFQHRLFIPVEHLLQYFSVGCFTLGENICVAKRSIFIASPSHQAEKWFKVKGRGG